MALEIDWQGKKAYARIEGVVIRKGRTPGGLRGSGVGQGQPEPEYGQAILYSIYESDTAAKLLSTGEYVTDFDAESPTALLPMAYGNLKTLKDFESAKDV